MQVPARQALICRVGAYGLVIAALYLFLGAPASSEGASEALGRAFAHTGFATLAVWLIARKKAPPWSWPKFVAVYVLVLVALGLIANAGRVRAADESLPFSVEFPDGWNVESLPGVSSAASDQSLGVRKRARWQGADGIAVIELTCSWLRPNAQTDPGV